jgi:integrase
MQLSDRTIRALKPKDKPYKATDGQGLYILVTSQGSRLWRFDYRFQGKRLTLSLGKFPDVGLADARARLAEARQTLAQGRDPGTIKQSQNAAANDNFAALADDWLTKRKKEGLAQPTIDKLEWFIRLVADDLGRLPVKQIGTAEVLKALRRVESREKYHSAKRLRTTLSRIFKYGVACGRAERDPAADLSEALTSPPAKSRAAITTADSLAGVLRTIQGYEGSKEIRTGLLLLIHLFCRPGELRHMEWTEIDTTAKLWLVPAPKMKMRQPHCVPLSPQAAGMLEELRILSGDGKYCFPSIRTPLKPISENTFNAALRRLGYTKEELCAHGFRSTASTLLNESGRFNADAIEAQLAHRPRGGAVRGAYMRGEFFDERIEMMSWWSDYLDALARPEGAAPKR